MVPLLTSLLLGGVLAGSPTGFPIHVQDGPVRLGEGELPGLDPAKPSGLSFEGSFEVKEPASRHLLVLEGRHVTSFNDPRYVKGEFRDVVSINGRQVGTLNDCVEGTDFRPGRIEVSIPEGVVRAGRNELRIDSGAGTDPATGKLRHDEIAFGKVWLYAAVPVMIRPREKGSNAPYPTLLVFESLEGDSGPIFGTSYRAAGSRRVAIDTRGETTLWLRSPGAFRVWAMRGMEYTAASAEFSTREGAPAPIDLEIERALSLPGWIGADLHVHSGASFDSQMSAEDRVASCAAAGLDFFVASEHNQVADLSPAIRSLGLGSKLSVAPGEEITTTNPELGHFNAFPLVPQLDKRGGGAVPFEHMAPEGLLTGVRSFGPGTILQVNHPRMREAGYFNRFQLDWPKGDGPAAHRALPGFSTRFDAIEVLNGVDTIAGAKLVLSDWFHLLEEDVRLTATGNSDSHKIVFQEVGWPRNFVRLGKDAALPPRAEDVVAAVRAHRITVSHGPVIRLRASGTDVIGDEITAPGGKLDLEVRIDAAPWVEVDRLDLVVNGAVAVSAPVLEASAVCRLDRTFSLTLPRDSWIVAVAEGARFQAPARQLHDIPPFAFTNPVWVRVVK
jgi:hypothetical protein